MSDVDAGGSDANDGLRRGLLTRTVYEVLASGGGPMSSSEVLSRVAERIDFTEREMSTNASGQVRWRTAASVAISRSTFGGWLTRDENHAYSLTDSGAEALAELSPDALWLEVTRRYHASKRDGGAQGVGWEPFLRWARELVADVDLDAEERDYKLKAAEKWAAAGAACATGSADWAERLRQAAAAGNFVDQFAQTWLRNRIQDHPDEVRAAFGQLHTSGAVDAIDGFGEELGNWGAYVSPGDRTVFASCVLLGVDPNSFPPYRPALGTGWAARVGETPGTSPGERYTALLSLCDGLLERWGDEPPRPRDRLDAQGLGWVALKWAPPDTWPPMKRAELQHWREGSAGEVRVDRGAGVSPIMESAAWDVLSAGLRGETSALVSGVRSWSVETAQNLADRLTTGESGLRFFERLVQQLAGAEDEVLCLAAEFLYIRDAPLHDMKASTKIDRIGAILASMSGAPGLPESQVAALDDGHAFAGGQGYHIKAPEHLQWLCRFVLHWLEQPPEVIDEALRDPFAFREVTTGVPEDSPSIRYAVEYLAWPGLFPSIVSADHRRRIRNGLIADLGKPSGDHDDEVTRDLVALRTLHERKNKNFYSWYDPPYVNRWRPGSYAGPRAWLIRTDAPNDVNRWLEKSCIDLRDEAGLALTPDMTSGAVARLVSDGYAHLAPSQREELTVAFHTFLEGVRPQDLVVALTDEQLMIGTVDDPSPNEEPSPSPLTRPVLWSASGRPLETLPAKLSAALEQEGHVVDLTGVSDLLTALLDDETVAPAEPRGAQAVERVMLPAVSQDLADELYMPVAPLQELVELLNRRRQLVVYGPPGTGKTYVAKKLAERLAGAQDPSRVRLVQFHPSYAYEDFFEGFRPVEGNGNQPFALQDGPLKLMAAEAAKAENRDKAYVLIIDELNRANLPKVFGELYFLLEYREETVRLQYRPDKPFSLPDNMFIIGTMNTADRSIALVDAAIRRRFPFYEMHPQREPVRGVLAAFAKRQQLTDDRVELLAELNLAMGRPGHDLHIGPSYLMRDGLDAPGALDLVWRYDILPLLHEHFYGSKSPEEIDQEFGLAELRRRIAERAKADGAPDDADA
ncbi:AAA family ATPase [Kribbella shirazensis]|uniref:5-methylcytosine-specific restriction protein B n=1 Tax=Kribbella shirazensis TaxID=1105143 RepID=A0A7X5ZZK6_9ACTN|nr:AAA family ATPase [Kribbella shirazensis]NIK55790.1 5-methylcytosine-specific restriction protein B [Kribbella shirazensis]